MYFNSIIEASIILGGDRTSISKCLKGQRGKAGGYVFKYQEMVTYTDFINAIKQMRHSQKEKILVVKILCVYLQCQTTKDPTV